MTDKMGIFLILGMLNLLAFGLRLYRLETKNLWQDAGLSAHRASQSLPFICSITMFDRSGVKVING